jgi:hypothetical protein
MADKKISQLTGATTPLAGTEVLPIVQGGSTVKVSAADVTAGRAVSAASVAVTGNVAPTNGVYLPAANTVGIAANSDTQFRVDSSGRTLLGVASALSYGGNSTAVRSQTVVSDSTTNTSRPVASFVRRTSGTPANGIGAEINLTAENSYSSVTDYAVLAGVSTDIVNLNGDFVVSTPESNVLTEQVRVTSNGNLKFARAGKGLQFGGNSDVIWRVGAGTPEGAVTAPVGSLFTRTDGGAGTTLYVKQSGTGNTGWVAK